MEDYVSFEQAKALKELGFDWKTTHYYDENGILTASFEEISADGGYEYTVSINNLAGNFNLQNGEDDEWCSAPTLSQAQKWLRDKKKILISIRPNDFVNDSGNTEIHYTGDIFGTSKGYLELLHSESGYENYEFALEDGINEALELLK